MESKNDDHYSDSEVSFSVLERENSNIYLKDSLTSMNTMLLREAREECKRLKYEFPGHTVNGQVRVKKSKSREYIAINSKQDLISIT